MDFKFNISSGGRNIIKSGTVIFWDKDSDVFIRINNSVDTKDYLAVKLVFKTTDDEKLC